MNDLKNKIMDIYDVRPSTAEYIQNIIEIIVTIAENEYTANCINKLTQASKPFLSIEEKEISKNSINEVKRIPTIATVEEYNIGGIQVKTVKDKK